MLCKQEGCDRDFYCKGFCAKHYYSNKRKGVLPGRSCSIDGCEIPAYRRGLCNTHALREDRNGDPLVRKKAANGECCNTTCYVESCALPGFGKIESHVYCGRHFYRMKRYGDPNVTKKRANGTVTDAEKKETARKAMATYAKTPHGVMRRRFNVAKARVLSGKAKGVGEITKDQFLELWNAVNCWICGAALGDDKTIDHKTPLSKGGTNQLDNLGMAHMQCNQKKSSKIIL